MKSSRSILTNIVLVIIFGYLFYQDQISIDETIYFLSLLLILFILNSILKLLADLFPVFYVVGFVGGFTFLTVLSVYGGYYILAGFLSSIFLLIVLSAIASEKFPNSFLGRQFKESFGPLENRKDG
jgi:hypothetical protein